MYRWHIAEEVIQSVLYLSNSYSAAWGTKLRPVTDPANDQPAPVRRRRRTRLKANVASSGMLVEERWCRRLIIGQIRSCGSASAGFSADFISSLIWCSTSRNDYTLREVKDGGSTQDQKQIRVTPLLTEMNGGRGPVWRTVTHGSVGGCYRANIPTGQQTVSGVTPSIFPMF